MKTQLVLFILFFLCACVAQAPKNSRSLASKTSTTAKIPSTPSSDSELYWFTTANMGNSLLIDQNTQSSVFFRGTQITNYFSTSTTTLSKIYCAVVSFEISGVKKQLRARAIPVSATDMGTGILRRSLRLDFHLSSENTAACSGIISTYGNGVNVAFSPTDLSSTLYGIYTSSSIAIYTSNSGIISDASLVPSSSLNFANIYLRINPLSNSVDPNLCSHSSCQAKGYDCCIDGQCAIDSTERSGASTLSSYAQAKADVAANFYRYIYWPEIYYVCPNKLHPTPTPTATPNAQATADANLQMLIKEYYCIIGGKADTPDYSQCTPTTDLNGYKAVKKDVWNRCGCTADADGTAPNNAETLCPNYSLKLIKDLSGNTVRVECDIPPNVQPTPFQNLNLRVPARSAPHRFFKATDGSAVDDITTLTTLSTEVFPEGSVFSYLDVLNKTNPQNGSYNINSLTGQFSVKLTGALPAKVVTVEYDQTYVIAANSGYFTPCPQCAKDSWFSNFKSAPSSQYGNGLQTSGYSTSRDSYAYNATLGNYEDTIWGRACWVPPTMLPFSHQKNASIPTQRLNRLATQAAFYINGYKRDWYGFNYGALIGSFDGVRWFAIGNGRKVTSTSTKLFLALNTPFSDLTSNNDLVVSITTSGGSDFASPYDYDPDLPITNPKQNQAGSCQAWHQCSTDTECVTKLGWEYVCADIGTFKTYWPLFDSSANEKSDAGTYTFNSILQGMLNGSSTKRCVYRGAGAPCKANFSTLTTTEQKKFLTCAPNFYCANVTAGAFNSEIARTPNFLGNYLYGQEADVLGRPLYYVGATDRLSDVIQSNIKKNASLFSSTDAEQSDFGMCRPGKKITGAGIGYFNFLGQHQGKDTAYRTDYISQISSCDSSKTGVSRVTSCPLFGTDGNIVPTDLSGYYQLNTTTGFSSTAEVLLGFRYQNTCGYEERYTTDNINFYSPFSSIELKPLSSLAQIYTPGIAMDACLRRAGSVCHDDFDCSPNKLHSAQAEYFSINYFGKTDAEKNYWRENLVCGQADPAPYPGATNYSTYDLTKNRCCRAIGNSFTMYTQSDSQLLTPSSSSDDITNLVSTRLPQDNPSTAGRYSRYSVVNIEDRANGAASSPYDQAPKVTSGTTPKEFQWKTIADTGAKTCCGSSWMRKFSDGTHDWNVSNRLNINFENFACLNYSNELYNITNLSNTFLNTKNYNKDYDKLCLTPDINGCAQTPITEVTSFELTNPQDADSGGSLAVMDTSQDPSVGPTFSNYSHDVPYLPTAFYPPASLVASPTLAAYPPVDFFKDPLTYFGSAIILPSYISAMNITKIEILYYAKAHANPTVIDITGASMGVCAAGTTNPYSFDDTIAGFIPETWCLGTDSSGQTALYAKANRTTWGGFDTTSSEAAYYHAGLRITFYKMNSASYLWRNAAGVQYTDLTRVGLTGANALYYLTKLGRLELSGIPQIFYEPLMCNSDRSKMVDGIFNSLPTRTGFSGISFNYNSAVNGRTLGQIYDSSISSTDASTQSSKGGAASPRITFMDKLATGKIFSDNEFMCCLPLGSKTVAGSNCCSNFAAGTLTEMKCALPSRTDLHVYFNRFVSGEGGASTIGGLVDDDFIPETGEPKLRQSTYDKIVALGNEYCSSKTVRTGGAFGKFYAEPNQGYYTHAASDSDRYFSIVDSIKDYDATTTNDNGYVRFNEGFRWNHHSYCN